MQIFLPPISGILGYNCCGGLITISIMSSSGSTSSVLSISSPSEATTSTDNKAVVNNKSSVTWICYVPSTMSVLPLIVKFSFSSDPPTPVTPSITTTSTSPAVTSVTPTEARSPTSSTATPPIAIISPTFLFFLLHPFRFPRPDLIVGNFIIGSPCSSSISRLAVSQPRGWRRRLGRGTVRVLRRPVRNSRSSWICARGRYFLNIYVNYCFSQSMSPYLGVGKGRMTGLGWDAIGPNLGIEGCWSELILH